MSADRSETYSAAKTTANATSMRGNKNLYSYVLKQLAGDVCLWESYSKCHQHKRKFVHVHPHYNIIDLHTKIIIHYVL